MALSNTDEFSVWVQFETQRAQDYFTLIVRTLDLGDGVHNYDQVMHNISQKYYALSHL